jgi:hypothetical protein
MASGYKDVDFGLTAGNDKMIKAGIYHLNFDQILMIHLEMLQD